MSFKKATRVRYVPQAILKDPASGTMDIVRADPLASFSDRTTSCLGKPVQAATGPKGFIPMVPN